MRRTRDVAIFCPCRDCYNSKKSGDIGEVRSHLFSRGFRDDYTCWDHHGERFEEPGGAGSSRATNVSETFIDRHSDVGEEIRVENIENVDSTNCTEYELVDEMMQDIPDDFVDIPEISEINDILSKDANVELFPGCTKYSKLTGVFKLFSLKVKNN